MISLGNWKDLSYLKWLAQRSTVAKVGTSNHPNASCISGRIVLLQPLFCVVLKQALVCRAIIELFGRECLNYAIDQIPLVLKRQIVCFKLLVKISLFFDFLWAMSGQLLLHFKFNVVWK